MVLTTGVLIWSAATFLCIPAFKHNPKAPALLVLGRVVIGMAEGCNYPSQQGIVSKWIPQDEMTTAWNLLTVGEAVSTRARAVLRCRQSSGSPPALQCPDFECKMQMQKLLR